VEEKVAAAVAQHLYRLTMDRIRQVGQQTMVPVIHLAVEEITLHPKSKTKALPTETGVHPNRLEPSLWMDKSKCYFLKR
jgi:hypothetical protein